jgi:hypothetical protein
MLIFDLTHFSDWSHVYYKRYIREASLSISHDFAC